MKAAYLILLMIICPALAPGAACADASGFAYQQTSPVTAPNKLSEHPQNTEHTPAPGGEKNQQVVRSPNEQRDPRHAPGTEPPRDRKSVTTANRSKHGPNNREYSTSTNVTNHQRSSSAKSEAAAKDGFTWTETVHNSQPVRPPAVARPAAPSLNNVRHRGVNPAIVGGPESSKTRNTGAIDGSHMNHRHTGN